MKKESVDEFYVRFVGIRDFLLSKDYLRIKKDPIEKNLFTEHFLLQIIILWVLQEDGFLNGDRRYLISSFCGYKQKSKSFRTYFDFLQELFKIMRGESIIGDLKESGVESHGWSHPDKLNTQSFSLDHHADIFRQGEEIHHGLIYRDSDFGAIVITGSSPFLQLNFSDIEIQDGAFYNPNITANSKSFSKSKNDSLPILNFLEYWASTECNIDEFLIGALYEKIMTKEKRKSSGSYYTPKYITSFICKYTIEDYLLVRLNDFLRRTNSERENPNSPLKLDCFDDLFKVESLDFYIFFFDILRKLTILDPAVGAGHFLISAIDTLSEIYEKLWLRLTELQLQKTFSNFPNNSIRGCDSSAVFFDFFEIDPTIPGARALFLLTLHYFILLPNTIFGVDINPSAIDIARARLFLSMAKNYDCFQAHDNIILSTIRFNLITGNSLVGFDHDSNIEKNYLDASNSGSSGCSFISSSYTCSSNIECGHFRWKQSFNAVFEKEGGFDIVLGNPPYVCLIENKVLRTYLEKEYADIYEGKADLWFYFLYNGIRLLNPQGQLSFVVSRYFLNAPIAKKLNRFLVDHSRIRNIWDFRAYKIFPGTNIQNVIIHVSKKEIIETADTEHKIKYWFLPESSIKNKNDLLFSQFLMLEVPQAEIRENLLRTNKMNFQWYEDDGIYLRIAEKVKKKLKNTLGQCAVVSKGILTGNDAVFTVSKAIIEKYGLEARFLRNYIKNSNIKPYRLDYDKSLFVIISHKRNAEVLRKEAPNIMRYFEDMKMQNRLSTASRSVKNPTLWRNGDERFTINWDIPKIITPYRAKYPCFALDTNHYLVPQDVVLIYPKNEFVDENTLYLWLSYFNSVIFEVLMMGGKDSGGMKDYLPGQIEPLPIPIYEDDAQQEFNQKIVNLTREIVKNPSNIHLEQEMLDIWLKIFDLNEIEKEKLMELERARIVRYTKSLELHPSFK